MKTFVSAFLLAWLTVATPTVLAGDKGSRGLFSPRMDYDQWTPLGRGDPLKNDPTYDYVPPVLDRVHYWLDASSRRSDPPIDPKKTEILLLGVSAKKQASHQMTADSRRDRFDPYLQYVDPPYRRRPEYSLPSSYYPSPFYKNSDKYTMMLPPPIAESMSYRTTTERTSSKGVSIEESRLVYQSSSVVPATYATLASSVVTWRTPVNKTVPVSFSTMNVVVEPSGVADATKMHKGHVTDDALDPYVSIGNAQVQSQLEELISTEPLIPPMEDAPMVSFEAPTVVPTTLQMTTSTAKNLLKIEATSTSTPSTSPTPSTSSLTTDPLFKHYKQPAEPIKGPLYLIIQGHSKVKTYGPSKQINGINIQETNEISTDDSKSPFQVKHLHRDIKKDEWKREGRSNEFRNLDQIVESGLGKILEGEGRSDAMKEAELVVKYDVSSGKETTSEIYHKGIVESDKPPSRLFPMFKKS